MPFVVEVNANLVDEAPNWVDGPPVIFDTQDEAVEYVCIKFDRLVEKSNEIMCYSSGEPMFPEGHEYEIDANVIFNTYRVVEVEAH